MDSKMKTSLYKEAEENFFIPTKKLASNFNNTIVINEFGDLFGWGSATNNHLGLNVELVEFIKDPAIFKFFRHKQLKIVDVAIGESHILAIGKEKDGSFSNSGDLYSWGLDMYGRLGYLSELIKYDDEELADNERYVFRRIPFRLSIPEKIARVSCGKDFSACLTQQGKLYTWGNNKWGNLGLNLNQLSNEELDGNFVVHQPTLVKHLENEQLIQVECGDKHMIVLNIKRRIFSWGEGKNGALGHGTIDSSNFPIMIKSLADEDIIFVCAGENTSAAINSKGQLYTWGNGQYGKLGIGSLDITKTPIKVTERCIITDRVFYISMGYYHTVCCSLEGRTFSMGYSYKGRMGCIPKDKCDSKSCYQVPQAINELNGVQMTQVKAGNFYSMAVSAKGKLYGWGENKNYVFGSMGEDDVFYNKAKSDVFYKPVELPANKSILRVACDIDDLFKTYFLSSANLKQNYQISKKFKITKIACGATHTLALTRSGDVLSWGYGTSGQLGQGEIDALPNPILINFNIVAKMEKIYAGRNHSMAITSITHQVYTWGDGQSGQLGYNKNSSSEPLLVTFLIDKECDKGCLGQDNSAVLTKNGEVYIWGSNTNNKLGLNIKSSLEFFPVLNQNLKNISTISLGLEHSGAVNSNGELFMWGNNLFGQLGLTHFTRIDTPTKVSSNIIFSKVKCGSYHSLFLDRNSLVYVCGKARLNLSTEEDKHKATIDLIDDFKLDKKAKKIIVGHGNSLVLTIGDEVYGFGKNDYSKAGGELTDEFIMKNARPIIIEAGGKGNKKRVSVFKAFAAYDHCFALSYFGDLYAWGNPRLYRLTASFGDEISKFPKMIDIEWLQKGNQEKENKIIGDNKNNSNNNIDGDIDENEDGLFNKVNDLDERQILTIVNKNLKIFSFKEIYGYIKRLSNNFNDAELIHRDDTILLEVKNLLKNLPSNFIEEYDKIKNLYMECDQLTTIRIKEINPPLAKGKLKNTNIPKEILCYTDEIEKILSYLFIHPCVIKSLFENQTPETSLIIIKGISPMYKGMEIKDKRSDNYLSLSLIALFRICLEFDYIGFRNDIDFFCTFKQYTMIELFLHIFLYDFYSKCALIEILKQSMNGLKDYAVSAKEMNKSEILDKIRKLITNKYDRLYYIDLSFLGEIAELTKLFLLDFENNFHKLPENFQYCFKYFKKYINKDQANSYNKDTKFLKMKLLYCMMRLFFSNVVGRVLQSLFEDENNKNFVCRALNIDIDSTNSLLVEKYLKIIGELIERVACNEKYVLKELYQNKDDEEEEENMDDEDNNTVRVLAYLNTFIEDTHSKLFVRFLEKFPKIKYNFKKNLISSMVYYNLSMKPHKINIDIKSLIDFFKFLSQRQSKFSGETKFQIFDAIKDYEVKEELKNKKMKFTLDVKYLINPLEFSFKYEKEIEKSQKMITIELAKETFHKCINCHVILPSVFFKSDLSTNNYLSQFKNKIKKSEFLYFTKILLHQHFKPNTVKSLKDILKNTSNMRKAFEQDFCTEVDEYLYLKGLEGVVNDIDTLQGISEYERMSIFVNELHEHIRRKIKHFYKLEENRQLIPDINDAIFLLKDFQMNLRKSMGECKGNLKLFANSLDFEEDKDIYEAKLSHKILNKQIYTNDNAFRYKPNQYKISFLKKNLIMLICEEKNYKENQIYLQISANYEKKYFDFKLRHKKTNDIIKSANLTFEEYFQLYINSSIYKNVYFPKYGKFNFNNLKDLIFKALSK